jgi:hypothetical protein
VRDSVDHALRRIEQLDDVRILLAVESGSRAWGFASRVFRPFVLNFAVACLVEVRHSDWDVRFVCHGALHTRGIDDLRKVLARCHPRERRKMMSKAWAP